MTDLFRRLQNAVPQVLIWIDRLLEKNAASATRVDLLAFSRLPQYWPAEVLRGARVVSSAAVPFPPVSAFGLPEFFEMENMPKAGMTFRDVFFVDQAQASEAVHFHELVHIVQWNALGPSNFLLTYGVGLAQFGYSKQLPLETIAYDLEKAFDRNVSIPDIKDRIDQHAFRTRESAAAILARYGVPMGS